MDEKGAARELEQSKGGSGFARLLQFVLIVALIALAVRTLVFSLFSIPSESMLPRLMVGDYLVAKKWSYGYSSNSLPFDLPLIPGRYFEQQPERGDVVIFKHPVDGNDYVKRVIGLPGDMVELRNGRVVLNGTVLAQSDIEDIIVPVSSKTPCGWGGRELPREGGGADCHYTRKLEVLPSGRSYEVLDFGVTPQDTWGPREVPAGTLFLLGDNRDNSLDSRFPALPQGGIGFVQQDLLVGRAGAIVWSDSGGGDWRDPDSWFSGVRRERIGSSL